MASAIIINNPKVDVLTTSTKEIYLKLIFTITNHCAESCKLTILSEEGFFDKLAEAGNESVCYVKLTPYDYPIKNCVDIKATVSRDEQTITQREFCLYQLKYLNANSQGFLTKVNELTAMIAKNGLTIQNARVCDYNERKEAKC